MPEDCNPPKESCRPCTACWVGADFGAAFEYNDSIDCLRSGRDGAAEAPDVPVVLDGRAGGADEAPPKKSKPSNESPGLVCFGGAASALGGNARPIEGPVVLGLGGAGSGSSPKRSMFCCCCLTGGGLLCGALAVARCDADLSNFAFS
jgi:hypothetical protein